MKSFLKSAIFLSLYLFVSASIYGQTSIQINETFNTYSLKESFLTKVDSSFYWEKNGISFFNNESGFQEYQKPFIKHKSRFPVIVKFHVQTVEKVPEEVIVEFQHADIDKLQLFVADKEGNTWESKILGDKDVFKNRYFDYRYFAVPLKLKPNNSYNCYLALEKKNRMITGAIVVSEKSFWEDKVRNQNVFNGLAFGVFFSFIILGFILFAVLKQNTYLYYGVYAISIFLLLFSINGYSYQFLFPSSPAIQNVFILLVQLSGLLFLNLYAFNFMMLHKISKHFNTIKNTLGIIYISIVLLILVSSQFNWQIEHIVSPILFALEASNFLFLLFVPVFIYIKYKKTEALVFSLSYLCVGVSLAYSILSFIFPAIPYVLLSKSLNVSFFIEMLILSSYMVFNYKKTFNEKIKAEQELNLQTAKSQEAFIEGQEIEKKNVALNLHDNIGAQLVILKNNIESISQNDINANKIDELKKQVSEISSEIRTISHEMLPVTLEDVGLENALYQLLLKHDKFFKTHFYSKDIPDSISYNISIQLYRIVQELLKNTVTHAQASNVYLQLIGYDDYFELHYEDDGKGFDFEKNKKGLGLKSIFFRAQNIMAEIDIESEPQRGFLCTIKTPLKNNGFGDVLT